MSILATVAGGFMIGLMAGVVLGALYEATEYALAIIAFAIVVSLGISYIAQGGDATAIGSEFIGWDLVGMFPGVALGDKVGADAYRSAFERDTTTK